MDEDELMSLPEPERESYKRIINRCEKAQIKYDLEKDYGLLMINMPVGRETRSIFISDAGYADQLAKIRFEEYAFIQGYEAIYSYADHSLEAIVRLISPKASEFVFSRLLNLPVAQVRKKQPRDLAFQLKSKGRGKDAIVISLSRPSDNLLLLTQNEIDEEAGPFSAGLSIKIEGLEIVENQQRAAILEKMANSLFFQMENTIGYSLMLEPYYQEPLIYPGSFLSKKKNAVTFPKYEYDRDPLNLYWYAKSATGMPLLQFLAYYQVLEFYFPTYSRKETGRAVANILKDIEFDPNRDLDVNKVISAVLSKMGRGYADERQQLRATIQACIESEEIHGFIKENPYIKDYFKEDFKKVSSLKVSVDNKDLDLRDQIAERLYDVRCKIVHTKSGESEGERIIPFTEEESLLPIDIEIIEFIARKTLMAGSSKLSI